MLVTQIRRILGELNWGIISQSVAISRLTARLDGVARVIVACCWVAVETGIGMRGGKISTTSRIRPVVASLIASVSPAASITIPCITTMSSACIGVCWILGNRWGRRRWWREDELLRFHCRISMLPGPCYGVIPALQYKGRAAVDSWLLILDC